jgi:hypothetical protein
MAKRRSRRPRRTGTTAHLGRIPLPPKPEQVIVPKPKRSDRAGEKARLRRIATDPDDQ